MDARTRVDRNRNNVKKPCEETLVSHRSKLLGETDLFWREHLKQNCFGVATGCHKTIISSEGFR